MSTMSEDQNDGLYGGDCRQETNMSFDTVPHWLRDFVSNLQPGDRVGITPAHEEAAGWNATFVRFEHREPNPRLVERGGDFAVVREDGSNERPVYIWHVHKPFNEA